MNGQESSRRWVRSVLTEGPLYLKGEGKGKGAPKGRNLSLCKHMIGM